ncbi:endonuclease/exonuclease/phosphatase family protein [Bauldia sp.]|uniref:endonuclease/exonuclease/phosphatase family protein n=1 Tax=Bauldia sp. TaxID=2575872 RepID=UPI003BAB3B40
MRLRLCTFNIENLFTRFDFSAFSDDRSARYLPPIIQFYGEFGDGDLTKFEDFKRFVQSAAISQDDDRRQHTALAFAEADADIYCLQEVDSHTALMRFMDAYVKKIGVDPYPQLVLHEGNDRRGIDVAAIARDIRPVMSRSYADVTPGWVRRTDSGKALLESYPKAAEAAKKLKGSAARIFRRDCLELEVRMGGKAVNLFNCHFKSMGGGRDASIGMRQLEAIAVREIINRRFENPENALWAVLGDLNDYRLRIAISTVPDDEGRYKETIKVLDSDEASGVDPLLDEGFGKNMLEAVAEADRWTHYYSGQRHKTQLDYIIASPELSQRVEGSPRIIRAGMPIRVPNLDVARYPRMGWDRPKASDHCPVVVEFDV